MQRRLSPRDEYLLQEKQRVNASATLMEKFQELKELSVDVAYVDSETEVRRGQMKYNANLAHAKSVFRFSCSNLECVQGDFDLSLELATAIANREETVTGELTCPGWRSRATIGRVPCHTTLRYTLNLEYQELAEATSSNQQIAETGAAPTPFPPADHQAQR